MPPGFGLKTASMPDLKADKLWRLGKDRVAAEDKLAGLVDSDEVAPERKPLTRAQKYLAALEKAQEKRDLKWRNEDFELEKKRLDRAARRTRKRQIQAEREGSEAESESEDSDSDGPAPLGCYYDKMQVEFDVFVQRASDARRGDTPSDCSSRKSTAIPESESAKSTPRVDFGAELQDLNEQMKDEDKDDDNDDVPDFIKNRKDEPACIRDHDNDRAAIALAGSCFYVPDAERLAMAPSLPPPPPPSHFGHRKWKMKPRLPLDISRNRYRDEHPSIELLRPPYVPKQEDIRSLEETMKAMSFYASCDKTFSRIAQNLGTRMLDPPEHELKRMSKTFSNMVYKDCKETVAWKTYLKRKRTQEIIAERLARAESEPSLSPGSTLRSKGGKLPKLASSTGSVGFQKT